MLHPGVHLRHLVPRSGRKSRAHFYETEICSNQGVMMDVFQKRRPHSLPSSVHIALAFSMVEQELYGGHQRTEYTRTENISCRPY